MRRANYIKNLSQDLRYALRVLSRSPGFTVTMVLTLALSIGANSMIFSVIEGVMLKPLPYSEPDRLYRIYLSNKSYPKFRLNPFDFRDFRARNRSFQSLDGFYRTDLQLSGIDRPQRLAALRITAGYFHMLGFRPALGREFEPKDELPGNARQVILSNRLWRRQFAADPRIVGRKLVLDSQPFTVVGVMPAGVQHVGNDHEALAQGDTVDVWWPFTFEGNPANRGSHYLDGIGRLSNTVTPEKALAEMNMLTRQLGREHPDFDGGWHILLVPLYQEVVGHTRRMLMVLLGAVGFVLLIACANVANLLLARATARQREIAVRSALGAARWRLISQMLTESIALSLLGAGLGSLIATAGVPGLVAFLPSDFPRAHAIHVDAAVFAFTFVVAVGAGLLFGVVPALQASHVDLNQTLRDGGRGSSSSARYRRLRDVLVASEVCLASSLLIGAGLILRSWVNLLHMNPGFRPEHVLTANLSLPPESYKTDEAMGRFYRQLVSRLTSLPGVRTAALGSDIPWTGYNENTIFNIEGRKQLPDEEFHARYHSATPDYFRALGIPLISGRFLTEQDKQGAPQRIVINESMARRYWPNESAVGKRITLSDTPKNSDWLTVVGIVGDVKDTPTSAAAEAAFWWPLLQQPFSSFSLVVRTDADPRRLVNAVTREVHQLDDTLAVAQVRLLDQIAVASVSTPRFTLFLVGLFSTLALALAAIGTYGVISYSVNQRTHEFGVRIALGAKPWAVIRLVLGQGMKLAIIGVVLGMVCALALSRVLHSLLYEVSAADPLTFAIVSLVTMLVAVLACYLPARRATRTNPMVALRSE